MRHNSEYDNIFHYFRGQTGEDSRTIQIENNATKALINVLQHAPQKLTNGFIRLFSKEITLKEDNKYTYIFQVTEKLEEYGTDGFVLGIAEETNSTFESDYSNKTSIPDAAILSEDVVVLIETKIGSNKLDTAQMENHKEKFSDNQIYTDCLKYLSWKEIRNFFKEQQKIFTVETSTGFLLRQFDQYCEINGLGGRTRENYFNYFPLNARKLAKEIDEFLWNGTFDLFEPPNTKNGIAYKRKGRRGGFAKLCTDRGCLILRFGSKGSIKGLEYQEELDKLLERVYNRNETDINKYSHETFVELRWIHDLEKIKPFIQKAYEMNP